MVKRTITGALLIIATALLFLCGGIPLQIGIFLLSIIGLYEFYKTFGKKWDALHIVGLFFTVFYYIYLYFFKNSTLGLPVILIVYLIVTLVVLIIQYPDKTVIDISVSIFGFLYVPFLFSTLWMIRESTAGDYLIWLVFITAWGTDTGAYCFGKLFGKRKLVPKLSPNKTVEGSIGGVITATLLSLLYGIGIQHRMPMDISQTTLILACVLTGLIGSVLAQLGDLSASSIKRHAGIKDFGYIFPGHGGVLDRFDSILFTAPAVFVMMVVLGFVT